MTIDSTLVQRHSNGLEPSPLNPVCDAVEINKLVSQDRPARRIRQRSTRFGDASRARGFTLLEVMIALLVIALGMGAVISTTTESGWKSSLLRQKTLASWVAQNQVALYRAKRTWDNTNSRSGEVEMANADWLWRMRISKTDDPSLRRIDVDVYLKDDDAVKASVTGFIARL